MMATHDGSALRARPMVGSADRASGTIWFVTNRSDKKDDELRRDPRVCLSYADPSTNTFVSVSGEATLSTDRRTIEDHWNPAFDAWFEGGSADPEALLIAVRPHTAEFWDNASEELMAALDLLTATAKPPEPALGDHCKVKM
ncbi:pyridoxamine 5'-phosphate oxidase family protein [Acuticoccus sp. I52.16.1]|nr:pyridoxamine 5'-phosphate oxidase family protein [Acuticoccus sp. I52.16.1]